MTSTPTNTPETVERLRPLLSDCPICGSPPRRNGKKGAGGVVCYAGSHRLQIIDDTQPLADAQWNEMAKDWADRQDRDAIVEKRLHLIEHIASVEHTANAIDRNGLNSCSRQLRDAARVLRAALSAPSPEADEDGPCTGCYDTGITIQTERVCSCDAGDQHRPKPSPDRVTEGEQLAPADAWQELVEYDDRTSPAEYPDMALITADELASFMERATPDARLREENEAQFRPMDTWDKRDETVLLLVDYSDGDHPLDDATIAITVGHNNDHNVGEGEGEGWKFAGWCWTHDHYVEGSGKPIGWMPIPHHLARAALGGETKA